LLPRRDCGEAKMVEGKLLYCMTDCVFQINASLP
jgi:hypothetical protein